MDIFKRAAAVAAINLRQWINDMRVRFLLLVIGYLVLELLIPFTRYGLDSNQTCTPWLLPYLFQSGYVSVNLKKLILHIGLVLLLCNAPFLYPTIPYMVLRSRRNAWWMGECLYIIIASLIYTCFLAALCFLSVLPVVTFEHDWGMVMRDMVMGTESAGKYELQGLYGCNYVLSQIFQFLDPWKAQLYSFLACWASFSVIGLLMYLVSLLAKSTVAGMAAAGVLIFLDPLLIFQADISTKYWLEALIPVCWTDVGLLKDVNRSQYLTIPYVAAMYAAWIVVLCICIWRVSHRVTIEVIQQR